MYKLGVVPYNYFTIYDAYYLWGVQEDEQMLSDADGAIAEGTWPEPKGGGRPPLAYHRRSYRIMRREYGSAGWIS